MKSIFKPLLISLFLCFPHYSTRIQACGPGFEFERYPYLCWLFHIDLIPIKALHALSYAHLESNYAYKNSDPYQPFNLDTTFYLQNVAEWQAAIAADPAITTQVADADIHQMLYNIDPKLYFTRRKANALLENSFIRAIQASETSKSLLNYLDFAKICEQLMNLGDIWEEDGVKKQNSYFLKEHIETGDSILRQKTTIPFVQVRLAFQIIKMAHYMGDTTRVMDTYKLFFNDKNTKSWVWGSASYYDAMAHQNLAIRNLLLANTFEHSMDKRWLSLQNLEKTDSIFSVSLTLANNAPEKARLMMLPCLLKEGRVLKRLEQIYQVDPKNNLFPIAIQREINKLENWIFTNRFTQYGSADAYFKPNPHGYESEQQIIELRNLSSDFDYLDDVYAFVSRVATERKQSNPAYWSLAAAHLAFLKRDFKASRHFSEQVDTKKGASTAMMLQKALTELLCTVYSSAQLGAEEGTAIVQFDKFLTQNQSQIFDYQTFRSQIMRFLSERYIAAGQPAQGILILSKSDLVFGDIIGLWEKNFYHRLLEMDNPAAIQTVIDLVGTQNRTKLTDFEQWLISEPKPYLSEEWRYFNELRENTKMEWNLSKLKDYKSILYIQRDELDSAYAVLKTIPDTFWQAYPYNQFLSRNPFRYMPHVPGKQSDEPLPTAAYTKTSFVKKLIELKQELKKDPIKYEQNYALIGTAYYNMTHAGHFWLMTEIYWHDYFEDHTPSIQTDYKKQYFQCQLASDWLRKGISVCQNVKYAALCCFMEQQCQYQRDLYLQKLIYQNKETWPENAPEPAPNLMLSKVFVWELLQTRFPEVEPFKELEYWCQHLEPLMQKIDP